jgi:site-specific DNA recombinase
MPPQPIQSRHRTQQGTRHTAQADAPPGSRAAIYARKSTPEDEKAEQDKSVMQQQRDARAFILKQGWTVADEHVFAEAKPISGKLGVEHRPALKRLLDTLEETGVDVIVMAAEDRLMRNEDELGVVHKRLRATQVQLWYHQAGRRVDLDTAIGIFNEHVRGFGSALYIENLTRHIVAALKDRARTGQVFSGKTFGYSNTPIGTPEVSYSESGKKKVKVRKQRVVNEEEAAVVRRIFTLFVNGQSPKQIAKRLTAEGAITSSWTGGHRLARWLGGTVREILLRSVYVGVHESTWPDGETITVRNKDWQIVSRALWDKTQARFRNNRAIYLRMTGGKLYSRPRLSNSIEAQYLLSGLLQCGACGSGMVRVLRSQGMGRKLVSMLQCLDAKRGRINSCTNTLLLPMAPMEAELTQIVEATLDEGIILEAVAGIIKAKQAKPVARQQQERDLARLTREVENLTAELAGGSRSAAVRDGLALREAQVSRLAKDLGRAGQPIDIVLLKKRLPAILKDWTNLSRRHLQQSRQLLSKLFPERITCTPKKDHYTFSGQVRLDPILAHGNSLKGS